MKIALQFDGRVAALPVEALDRCLPGTSRADLAVLLAHVAEPGRTVQDLSDAAGVPLPEVLAALSRWQAAGVLTVVTEGTEHLPLATAPASRPGRHLLQAAALPAYSTEETAKVLEGSAEISALIDACQQIMGKMFSTSEINILVGLTDYLSLEADYILLLCNHCAERGKKSMRYVEKTALSLFDEGVTGYRELEEHFRLSDAAESAEGQVRTLFGLGARSLTKKEKQFLQNWTGVWGFGMEIIEKAFEVTVNSTGGRASMHYADRVLENWHTAGYTTLEEIDAALAEHRREKQAVSGGTFDTDDFFEAALRRSYGDDIPPADAGKS